MIRLTTEQSLYSINSCPDKINFVFMVMSFWFTTPKFARKYHGEVTADSRNNNFFQAAPVTGSVKENTVPLPG